MKYKNQQKHDDISWKNRKMGWKTRVPNEELVKISKKIKGKILDLGCGEGRHAIFLAKKGCSAYGVDYSEEALKKAKAFAKEEKVKVEFKKADMFNLPYKENFFDLIIDCGLLHHIKKKDWNKYIKNVKKMLKPEGYYFSSQFSKNSKRIRGYPVVKRKRNWNITGNFYDHFFTKKEYKELFKDFKVIKISEGPGGKHSKKLLHFFGQLK